MTKNKTADLNREVGELKVSVESLTKITNEEFIKLDNLIIALNKEIQELSLQSKQYKFGIKFLLSCSAVFTGVLVFGYKALELLKKVVTALID